MAERILISADGGIGDHITAEPAIRYFIEHFGHGRELHIAANWPRIFAHLSGVTVHPHNFDRQGVEYKTLWSFTPNDSPLYNAVCFLLCHMVDYHAMQLLKQMIPLTNREIRLRVDAADRDNLRAAMGGIDPKECVLVHAGKNWRTKTFPLEWWQKTVDAMAQRGLRVCLIGKSASDIAGDPTGIQPVVCPQGGVDLRDKINLGTLFALVEQAPVLVSNESAPIQIAGAFDNHIVLIASALHPDMVFPYRKGSTQYKTKGLYKKLLADTAPLDPLNTAGFMADFEVPDWSPYLPDPSEVAQEVGALLSA